MSVVPIPYEATRYYVQSQSRPEMNHVVDTDYEGNYECFCEARQANEYTKGQECKHIKAVKAYETVRKL